MLDKIVTRIEKMTPEKWRWILSHEGFKRYFANTGWMFFGQFFYLGVSFLVGAWIARYLGPEKYGIVSYAVAFGGLFSFISSLGVDGTLNRELVSHPEKRDELLGTAFRLKLIGGGLAFVSAAVAAIVSSHDNPFLYALIIIFSFSFFFQAPNVITIFFHSQVKARENIKAQIAAASLSALLKIIFIVLGGNILWLILIYVLDYVWQAIFLVYFYKAQGYRVFTWKFKPELARSLWRASWPLMLSSAAVFIYLRIGQVIVGRIMGETAVGIYAAGVKITEVFYFLPIIICSSLFPAIVNGLKTGAAVYRRRLQNFYGLLGGLSVVVALGVTFLARPIINFTFGSQYLAAVPILQIYIWSSVGLFLGTGVSQQLMAENRMKAIFGINLIAMVVNIGLNILLIPRLGLTGAALAAVTAYSVMPFWMLFANRKTKN